MYRSGNTPRALCIHSLNKLDCSSVLGFHGQRLWCDIRGMSWCREMRQTLELLTQQWENTIGKTPPGHCLNTNVTANHDRRCQQIEFGQNSIINFWRCQGWSCHS
ncbi:unnamed protein product [Ixodes pacificus]